MFVCRQFLLHNLSESVPLISRAEEREKYVFIEREANQNCCLVLLRRNFQKLAGGCVAHSAVIYSAH